MEIPNCPNCGKPLSYVREYANGIQDFYWSPKDKKYKPTKFLPDMAARMCGRCLAELDNKTDDFVLEHI